MVVISRPAAIAGRLHEAVGFVTGRAGNFLRTIEEDRNIYIDKTIHT